MNKFSLDLALLHDDSVTKSHLCLFLLLQCILILKETLLPKLLQGLNSYVIDLELPTALDEEQPLDLVIRGKYNFDEHDGCSIHSDGDEHNSFSGLPGHEKVNVEEQKGQNCIVHEPICDEWYFFDEVALNTLSVVSLRTPGNVIHVAKCIDKHNVGVCALVYQVADAVDEQFEYEGEVWGQMDQSYHQITCYVYTRNYKH